MKKTTWCSRILAVALVTGTAIGSGACVGDAGEREESELWEDGEEVGEEEVGEAQQAVFTNRPLAMGTATYSQTNFSVDEAIDGDAWGAGSGWAIWTGSGTPDSEAACFELASAHSGDTPSGKTKVRFRLKFGYGKGTHLGLFRVWVTTSSKDRFADGVNTDGKCYSGPAGKAVWQSVNFTARTATAASGTAPTLSMASGNHVLADACDGSADNVEYILTGTVNADRITGVMIQAVDEDDTSIVAPHLPGGGPGCAWNGNITLTDLQFQTEPVN